MTEFDCTFPPALAELHTLEFDHAGGDGIDFEPYNQFLSASDNASWIRAWTGNDALDGREYRIFGQDGTGGYVAFWLRREGRPLLDQPIVFFGSEGSVGVLAADFADYLWLLAAGVGPFEAIEYANATPEPIPHFAVFAATHAAHRKRSVADILRAAALAFPTFVDDVRALCQ